MDSDHRTSSSHHLLRPIFTAINQRFPADNRPLALAIVTVVGGSAGIIFIPFVQFVVSSLGWRTGVMTLGLIPIVSGLLVTGFSLRGTAAPNLGGLTEIGIVLRPTPPSLSLD